VSIQFYVSNCLFFLFVEVVQATNSNESLVLCRSFYDQVNSLSERAVFSY
jgi:hypothetical protein